MATAERNEANKREENTQVKSDRATEANEKGGKEPARRQADRDWQDSAKESGE